MHKIILHRNAVKFYQKAEDALKERVADAIDVIARNPHLDGHIKKLKGDIRMENKSVPFLPHDQHHEKVSVKRLREISINIHNEMSIEDIVNETGVWIYQPPNQNQLYANP